MIAPTVTTGSSPALKAAHRARRALGDFPDLATDIVPDPGQVLISACDMRRGDRVPGLAAGSGDAATRAARAGASAAARDLIPEWPAAGQRHAALPGTDLEWRQAGAGARA
jgi:hypothetical protein